MAEIRISGRDLARIDQAQKQIAGAVSKLNVRDFERLGADLADKLNGGVQKILANIDKVQERLGIADLGSQRAFRETLEGAEGATSAVKELAPFLPLLAASPQARIALLAAGALFGALEGSGREERRRAIARAAQIESDHAYRFHVQRQREAAERREAEAARKRARRGIR